jgi:phytol kinase
LLHNNLLATIFTFAIALAWLRLNDFAAHRGWVSGSLSRKIIHIGTGPIFVLSWLFFDDAWISRWLAALVPFAITVQFALVGTGAIKDEAAVRAMSRSGRRSEILRGPLYYGIVFIVLTLVYWKGSPIGIVALMLMCGGDGLADVVGRRWGSVKLSWNPNKSWVGSLGMLLGGWILAAGIYSIYVAVGIFSGPVWISLPALTLIALICTFVEMLPIKDVDNLTVTAAAILLGHLLLPR